MDFCTEHQPVSVHQQVAFPTGLTLRPIVASLRSSNAATLDRLAVDHCPAWMWVASLCLAHCFTQPLVGLAQSAVDAPFARKWGSRPSAKVDTPGAASARR